MVTCLKTHGMFLLVESGIKQSCYSNYFSSMLVFSALKILEISKSPRYVDFLSHMSSEKYHFKCYQ